MIRLVCGTRAVAPAIAAPTSDTPRTSGMMQPAFSAGTRCVYNLRSALAMIARSAGTVSYVSACFSAATAALGLPDRLSAMAELKSSVATPELTLVRSSAS